MSRDKPDTITRVLLVILAFAVLYLCTMVFGPLYAGFRSTLCVNGKVIDGKSMAVALEEC